ncbi:plastocyanin/azurin family copper-binding protein [Halobacterium salinarum]|uniref:plastocyanin/azurin family copper-binding protein n=1 Tax=Halobacterium salinarum TaxID=2242 RepID=UPI00255518D5|nr:plastocyanin/azurin family copper-binding protein [Halobacterium salinarum]MDL0122314.1 plastocyanin/azurin family copper-binding protein [Halobacterium salinarum]
MYYSGSVRTTSRSIPIAVGGHDCPHAFQPALTRVAPGKTVTWAGEESGGAHTVAFKSAAIGIRKLRSEPGVHFTHTFNSTGTYRYFCSPHSELSGRGAVIVE